MAALLNGANLSRTRIAVSSVSLTTPVRKPLQLDSAPRLHMPYVVMWASFASAANHP